MGASGYGKDPASLANQKEFHVFREAASLRLRRGCVIRTDGVLPYSAKKQRLASRWNPVSEQYELNSISKGQGPLLGAHGVRSSQPDFSCRQARPIYLGPSITRSYRMEKRSSEATRSPDEHLTRWFGARTVYRGA